MSYDAALTIFSPTGELFQVMYACRAAGNGNLVVITTGMDVDEAGNPTEPSVAITFAENQFVKRKPEGHVDDSKVFRISKNVYGIMSGLTADGRQVKQKLILEGQNWFLSKGQEPTVEHVARMASTMLANATLRGGRRPYGVSLALVSVEEGVPRVMILEPGGACRGAVAYASGKNSKDSLTFLEKNVKSVHTDPEKPYDLKENVDPLFLALQALKQGSSERPKAYLIQKGVRVDASARAAAIWEKLDEQQ